MANMRPCVVCGDNSFYELRLVHEAEEFEGKPEEVIAKLDVCESCGRKIMDELRNHRFRMKLEEVIQMIKQAMVKVEQMQPEALESLIEHTLEEYSMKHTVDIVVPEEKIVKERVPVQKFYKPTKEGKKISWWMIVGKNRKILSQEEMDEMGLKYGEPLKEVKK